MRAAPGSFPAAMLTDVLARFNSEGKYGFHPNNLDQGFNPAASQFELTDGPHLESALRIYKLRANRFSVDFQGVNPSTQAAFAKAWGGSGKDVCIDFSTTQILSTGYGC